MCSNPPVPLWVGGIGVISGYRVIAKGRLGVKRRTSFLPATDSVFKIELARLWKRGKINAGSGKGERSTQAQIYQQKLLGATRG